MKFILRTVFLTLVSTIYLSFAWADIPNEYYANYSTENLWNSTLELMVEMKAYEKSQKDVPKSKFGNLHKNFEKLFEHFPQKATYKQVYKQCLLTTDTLSTVYTAKKFNNFKDACYNPINEIIAEVNKNFIITANIDANPRQGPAPLNVTFDARGSEDPSDDTIPNNNYFWYYKDINGQDKIIGKGSVINHTFTQPGSYVVHLTVRSVNKENEGVFDGSKTIVLNVDPRAANLSVYAGGRKLTTDYIVKIGSEQAARGIIIDGSGTNPTGGRKIVSHRWIVQGPEGYEIIKSGSGIPRSFEAKMPRKGEYEVTLEVKDNQSNSIAQTYRLVVADPVATIKHSPETSNTSTLHKFDAALSYSVKSKIKTYKWTVYSPEGQRIENFEGKSFQRKFTKPGNYTVKLTIIDDLDNMNEDQVKFYVESTPPIAQFISKPMQDWENPSQFILDATASYDPDKSSANEKLVYDWIFSNNGNVKVDRTIDGGSKLYVSFNEVGKYNVKLQVKDINGLIGEIEKEIEIKSSIRPVVKAYPRTVIWGSPMKFTVDSNKTIAHYEWDFGDGVKLSSKNNTISHIYKNEGVYKVTLKVSTIGEGSVSESNEVSYMAFVGSKNSPIPSYIITQNNSGEIMPTEYCIVGNKTVNSYPITRNQQFRIDGTNSVNSKGEGDGMEISFIPKEGNLYNDSSIGYSFDEIGCSYIDMIVKDTNVLRPVKRRIRFKVKNSIPTLDNIELTFPQYGNEMGVGLQNQQDKTEAFKVQYDPLIVKVNAKGAKDEDGVISHYIWYYYKVDNPDKILELKTTPANVSYAVFSIPRIPGEFTFGVKIVDNDGDSQKSEKIIGRGPSLFFPPDTRNPDIPIVTLRLSKDIAKVGDEVEFHVVSKLASEKSDFIANRVIKYDFDGDGEYDLTTKKNNVTHVYKTPTQGAEKIRPKVKVIYRGYAGLDYGEIQVQKGLKSIHDYDVWDNKVLVRDMSVGDITQKVYCMDHKECDNPDYLIENKNYFSFNYDGYGKKIAIINLNDKSGDELKDKIVLDLVNQRDDKKILNLMSIPKAKVEDGKYEIIVGNFLENSILYYINYDGEADQCYIDADITVDSNNDGNPEEDRDIKCNEEVLYAYQPRSKSVVARIYYKDGEDNNYSDININFLDFEIEMNEETQKVYDQITDIIAGISESDSEQVRYLSTLLINLRSVIADKDNLERDSLIMQINDWFDINTGVLDESIEIDIKELIRSLSDGAVNAALGGNEYENAKTNIQLFMPSEYKEEVDNYFTQIEQANGDQELIKKSLQSIFDIAQKLLSAGNFDQSDYEVILTDICNIMGYYDIPSELCKTGINVPTEEEPQEDGGIIWTILKYVLIVIGVLVVAFIGLTLVFAMKAKNQRSNTGNKSQPKIKKSPEKKVEKKDEKKS